MPVLDSSKQQPVQSDWYGIPAADLELIRRLTVAVVAIFLLTAAFTHLKNVYEHKFLNVTGKAEWIWARVDIARDEPVAFFATRDFDLPAGRYYTHVKVSGDPEYTLYLNGVEIGGRRATDEHELDAYDVGPWSRTGRNRMVIATRAPRGVGGVIAAVDLSPETANYVVTDGSWRISTHWTPELLEHDAGPMQAPAVIGEPPVGRWNYLQSRHVAVSEPPVSVRQANAAIRYVAQMPVVKVVSGIPIVSLENVPAIAYDLGETDGRLRLIRVENIDRGEMVSVRFANAQDELASAESDIRQYVFAAGERAIVDPEERHFRYAAVYRSSAIAEAVLRK